MMIYTTTYEGFTEQRKSAGHSEPMYKFAVWGFGEYKGKPTWGVLCYCSRMDLAQAQVRQRQGWYGAGNINIAPVTAEHKTVKAKADVDFPGETFEMAGVSFSGGNDTGVRFGNYRGWAIRLSCSGKVFRATAMQTEDDWHNRLYVANGGLESRVEAIKAAIDAKVGA